MLVACLAPASAALASAPYTSIDEVTVTAQPVQLSGSVNPNGEATTARFEYGQADSAFCTALSGGAPEGATVDQDLGSGADPLPVTANVSGLSPGTSYCVKLVAHNAYGDGASFNYFTPGSSEPGNTGGGETGSGNPSGGDTSGTGDLPPAPTTAPPGTTAPPVTTTGPPVTKPAATKCIVPKLTGLTLARAKKALSKAHCGLGRLTKKAAKAPIRAKKPKTGTVIAQSPKPGTRKTAGAKVALTLAR
jgi:PASTA domain